MIPINAITALPKSAIRAIGVRNTRDIAPTINTITPIKNLAIKSNILLMVLFDIK